MLQYNQDRGSVRRQCMDKEMKKILKSRKAGDKANHLFDFACNIGWQDRN